MPSNLRIRRVPGLFWDFVPIASCAPPWVSSVPIKSYDRIVGFCPGSPDTESFVLADEALFLMKDARWRRVAVSEIRQINGTKGSSFMDTVIAITTLSGEAFEYRGKNAFSLWSCLEYFINDASKRIELHLSSDLIQMLEKISRNTGRKKNDIAKDWLTERIQRESEAAP